MKKKIGMVAVGQAPRTDIMPGMKRVLGADVQVIEKGALDGLSLDEIQSLYPKEGMTTIVTRLADGTQVIIGEEEIIPRVQTKIKELNREGVELIVLLCTGHFPRFQSECLLIESQKVVDQCVAALIREPHALGVMVPLPEQMDHAKENLKHLTSNIVVASASPYGSVENVTKAAEVFKSADVELVVMHCMGFTNAHRRVIREVCGKPVLLSNSIVARTVAELVQF